MPFSCEREAYSSHFSLFSKCTGILLTQSLSNQNTLLATLKMWNLFLRLSNRHSLKANRWHYQTLYVTTRYHTLLNVTKRYETLPNVTKRYQTWANRWSYLTKVRTDCCNVWPLVWQWQVLSKDLVSRMEDSFYLIFIWIVWKFFGFSKN